jgi:uncharacterized protein (DUF2062 family)
MGKLRMKVKAAWTKIRQSNATPHQIALGLALGVFVAWQPLVPIQTLLLLAVFLIARRANKLAAYAASWVMNQFTLVPIYLGDFWVGSLLYDTGAEFDTDMLDEMTLEALGDLGGQIAGPLLLGGAIVGGACALVTYTAVKIALVRRERNI